MKELIGKAMDEGEKLDTDWFKRTDDANFKHAINVWTNKTGHLIEDAYGKGEATVWMSDAGYTSYSDGKVHTDMHNWIVHRLQRLNDLVGKVDTIPMQPNFDPKNYYWVTECPNC